VQELTATYERGVKVTQSAFATLTRFITRDWKRPKWSLTITPATG